MTGHRSLSEIQTHMQFKIAFYTAQLGYTHPRLPRVTHYVQLHEVVCNGSHLGNRGWVYIILFLLQNIDCGLWILYELDRHYKVVLKYTHNLCFKPKKENIKIFN